MTEKLQQQELEIGGHVASKVSKQMNMNFRALLPFSLFSWDPHGMMTPIFRVGTPTPIYPVKLVTPHRCSHRLVSELIQVLSS